MNKTTILTLILIVLCSSVWAEKVLQISWDDPVAEIKYHMVKEEQHVEIIMGPQAIGVDAQNNIYILDNLSRQILVYKAGKLKRRVQVQVDGCGLAVAPDGGLAVFSPMGKTVNWLEGDLAGKSLLVDALPAISEVWYYNKSWWARCGNQTISLSGKRAALALEVRVVGSRKVAWGNPKERSAFMALSTDDDIVNAWGLGHRFGPKQLYMVLETVKASDQRQTQIFRCDLEGRCSDKVALGSSLTEIFCSYTLAPDGALYTMVTDADGINIYRHDKVLKLSADRQTEAYVAEEVPAAQPAKKTEDRGVVPTYVDVLFRHENKVRRVKLQDYLKGVVSAEIYGSWHQEAHRAMAVAARTYTIGRKKHTNADVCTSTHCQAWKADINAKAAKGVDDTDQVIMYYNGQKLRSATYFAHCNGHTRNSEDIWNYVPYLRRRPCACGKTKYYGHGVGACQHGLQAYALKGWSYSQILRHYYTGVEVKR